MPTKVAVIGAGVTGLSAALRLLEEDTAGALEVTVVARDFPGPAETLFLDPRAASIHYTSPWGGAHNRWVLWTPDGSPAAAAAERDHAFALATYRHMLATQARFPEAGITFLPGIEYLEAPGPEYTQLADPAVQQRLGFHDADLGLGFRVLDGHADADLGPLPAGVAWGCTYRTWCVHPMVYCSFLLRRFVAAGGRLARRTLRSPHELFARAPAPLGGFDVVVNCSGAGFGDDPDVYVLRGQTCLVRNPCAATVTRQNADGSWSFSVPRFFDGGTVVGGTKEADDWDPEPSPATRARLLAAFAQTHPAILASGPLDVLHDIVGRRPMRRGGMRLEAETLPLAPAHRPGQPPLIVHAYGVGGRGYEMSWGVAGAVVDLVKTNLWRGRCAL